jgi:hypothetical protein
MANSRCVAWFRLQQAFSDFPWSLVMTYRIITHLSCMWFNSRAYCSNPRIPAYSFQEYIGKLKNACVLLWSVEVLIPHLGLGFMLYRTCICKLYCLFCINDP